MTARKKNPLLNFLFIIITLLIGISLFWFYLNLRAYSRFSRQELAAQATCKNVGGDIYDMSLKIKWIKNGKEANEDEFLLKGNQWCLEGNILKWSPKMNLLGLHTMHKVTRIRGRYLAVQKELRMPQTVYEINSGEDLLWRLLYKFQKLLPFVEAVYGNSAYTFPDAKAQFLIYVTTSGYIIKKAPLK